MRQLEISGGHICSTRYCTTYALKIISLEVYDEKIKATAQNFSVLTFARQRGQ